MRCKTCGAVRPYCRGCEYDPYKSKGFCNEQCFLNHSSTEHASQDITNWVESLTRSQIDAFMSLCDRDILSINDCYYPFITRMYASLFKNKK